MKIKLVSDLHLEFSTIKIDNHDNCDVLILSGDIMLAQPLHDHPDIHLHEPTDPNMLWKLGRNQEMAVRFRKFLKQVTSDFPHVVYVAGNHEFYGGKWQGSVNDLRAVCSEYPNLYFLERDTKVIDDVVFVGGTLWTDMNKGDPLTLHAIKDMMNDFRVIRNDQKNYKPASPMDAATRHKETLDYFRIVLSENKDKKCVVVGHHSPSHQSIHAMYNHDSLMNGGYHSELSEFILDHPQVKLWTHGHTHHPFDYVIGETRVVCNPRGYQDGGYDENTGWNPHIVLEV